MSGYIIDINRIAEIFRWDASDFAEAVALDRLRSADRSAARVRFAAIALASAAVVFLLAIIAGGMT